MNTNEYGDFPTMKQIKRDYKNLMKLIKNVKTIEQAKELEKAKKFTIEINGMSIDEFTKISDDSYICTNKDIEWIRFESFGCLSYIYHYLDNKPMFDVFCNFSFDEFIHDITIDKLTNELYKSEKERTIRKYKGIYEV